MTAARDRKNLLILLENSAGESTAGVMYLSMRIHPKSCCICPLKVSADLLDVSRNCGLQDISCLCWREASSRDPSEYVLSYF